jgi:hypothetical protein
MKKEIVFARVSDQSGPHPLDKLSNDNRLNEYSLMII